MVYFQSGIENEERDEMDKLEFFIELEPNEDDITNNQIFFQFRNIDDKPFNYTYPEVGKSLDFIIEAENGTEYHFQGPVTPIYPWHRILSPDEIKDGHQFLGYKYSYLDPPRISSTNWINSSKNEYWYFQPGSYNIYGEYESKPNNDLENVLVGTWRSNVVELTIEPKFIEVTTDKSTYTQGENITINLKNISNDTLNEFHGWENYTVLNYDKEIVYQQNAVTHWLSHIAPQETERVDIWNQTDIDGTQLPPGYYIIEKYYSGHLDETGFYIQR